MAAHQPTSLALPCVLGGRYECRRRIGAGGMGEVYLARHLGLERDVAVKLLTTSVSDPGQLERVKERFRREAVALSRLRHPNTIQVLDFGWTDDQRPYIVTELLTGRTLDQELRACGSFEPERAVRIVTQICRSLAEAHQYRIVHRDLKPSNVFLIEAFGTVDYVKLIDFGVARIDMSDEAEAGRPLTVEGTTLGTPDYMAPEQARGQAPVPATDVYALGCMLFEMLVGHPPFLGDSALQVMIRHIKDEPPSLASARPDLSPPPGLEEAIGRCLKKNAAERPTDAGSLLDVLQKILDAPKPAAPAQPAPVAQPPAPAAAGGSFFQDASRELPRPPDPSGLHRVRTTGAPARKGQKGYRRPVSLRRGRGRGPGGAEDAPEVSSPAYAPPSGGTPKSTGRSNGSPPLTKTAPPEAEVQTPPPSPGPTPAEPAAAPSGPGRDPMATVQGHPVRAPSPPSAETDSDVDPDLAFALEPTGLATPMMVDEDEAPQSAGPARLPAEDDGLATVVAASAFRPDMVARSAEASKEDAPAGAPSPDDVKTVMEMSPYRPPAKDTVTGPATASPSPDATETVMGMSPFRPHEAPKHQPVPARSVPNAVETVLHMEPVLPPTVDDSADGIEDSELIAMGGGRRRWLVPAIVGGCAAAGVIAWLLVQYVF